MTRGNKQLYPTKFLKVVLVAEAVKYVVVFHLFST